LKVLTRGWGFEWFEANAAVPQCHYVIQLHPNQTTIPQLLLPTSPSTNYQIPFKMSRPFYHQEIPAVVRLAQVVGITGAAYLSGKTEEFNVMVK
jgi:hypothetical protein